MPSLVRYKGGLLRKAGGLAYATDPCTCCAEPCDADVASGGGIQTLKTHSMPRQGGTVRFTWDAYNLVDQFTVFDDAGGQVFVDTGIVSGAGEQTFCKPEGLTKVSVRVTGRNPGTRWKYTISCPESPCDDGSGGGGAGSELTRLLSFFWVRHTSGCQCSERASRMDEMGPEWCRENRDLILSWLQEEAQRRGIPFVRSVADMVLEAAISRAERRLRS